MTHPAAVSPYRSAPAPSLSEPWLERLGWSSAAQAALAHAPVVAVHAVWDDVALGVAHLRDVGDFDPWSAIARLGPTAAAVRLRGEGAPMFVFADDAQSAVEGPGGALSLATLVEERLVEHDAALGGFVLTMEPGLVYRTCRRGVRISAELVAHEVVDSSRRSSALRAFGVTLALLLLTWFVGAAAVHAAAPPRDARIAPEPAMSEATLAGLIARASERHPAVARPAVHCPRGEEATDTGGCVRTRLSYPRPHFPMLPPGCTFIWNVDGLAASTNWLHTRGFCDAEFMVWVGLGTFDSTAVDDLAPAPRARDSAPVHRTHRRHRRG